MKAPAIYFFFLGLLCQGVFARPTVREIKDATEFNRLLKHHATETGLPVIVDFFSESCGPCRMIAPVFKAIAQEYAGKAVFAKVNTAKNQQLSQQYQVRSIPTFMFFLEGKKKKEFSGAGEQQLQSFTREIVSEAKKVNTRLTLASLSDFYATHDASKTEREVQDLHTKCAKLSKTNDCVGGPANDLTMKLKKKYGSKPVVARRFDGHDHSDKKEPSSPAATPPRAKKEPLKPNLHLAKYDELEAEYLKRKRDLGIPEECFPCEEELEEEEDDDFAGLTPYYPRDVAERVVIIGAGPAGLSSAVYTARAGLKPVVIAPPFGGQLMGKGVEVENYPGLLDQTGPSLVGLMQTQAMAFGTRFHEQSVVSVDLNTRPFSVQTDSSTISTHSIIIATGADSRWLGVSGENDFRGGGVSTCATCDGFLFRNQPVVVVGGGDTAMEDALVLARTSSSVTVVHRRDSFRANKALADRVLQHSKINVVWNSTVKAFLGDEDSDGAMRLSHVELVSTLTGEESLIDASGAFIAIGHIPNTEIFRGTLDMDGAGYIKTFHASTVSNVDGVFTAGDVADPVYRQAITSAGSGAMAALDAERWLSANGYGEDGEEEDSLVAELLQDFAGANAEHVNIYDHIPQEAVVGQRETLSAHEVDPAEEILEWAERASDEL